MLLSEPGHTPYDLSFNLFGIPVRVHPGFFVIGLLFGANWIRDPDLNAGVRVLLGIGVIFISILVHELGHVLAYRYFGQPGRIVLHWMGGLAIADSGNMAWARQRAGRFTSNQQIIISLAGPFAGMLLILPLLAVVYAAGGTVVWNSIFGVIPLPVPNLAGTALGSVPGAWSLIWAGVLINLFWNLINLVPIYPLDGGQVSRELFVRFDPWNGLQNSLLLSVAAGIGMAIWGFSNEDQFIAFFFAYMAWQSFQSLQHTGGNRRPW
jgi:Zn-dependent protease